jgi:hypothetical protein
MVRQTISLILALTLTIAGVLSSVYVLFFAADRENWMLLTAAGVFGAGLVWLYSDYIDASTN